MAGNPDRVFRPGDYSGLKHNVDRNRGKAMIDYTDMFTRIQAAEKELRGMGLRTTSDGKLTPEAEYEVRVLLYRYGITGAKAILESHGVLRLVPEPGPLPSGACECIACTAMRLQMKERQSVADQAKARLPPLKVSDLFTAPGSFDAMLDTILGQGPFATTYSKSPEEPRRNTYRTGQVKPEARSLPVLDIKERARAAFSFPIGSINSAMLGDALGDAYIAGRSAGERLAKQETAYSGELRLALQGYAIAAAGEWGDLLSSVATMVRNARNKYA